LLLIAVGVATLAAVLIFGAPTAAMFAKRLRGLAGGPDGSPSLLVYTLAAGFTFLAVLLPLPARPS
jgi:hypothetical protein